MFLLLLFHPEQGPRAPHSLSGLWADTFLCFNWSGNQFRNQQTTHTGAGVEHPEHLMPRFLKVPTLQTHPGFSQAINWLFQSGNVLFNMWSAFPHPAIHRCIHTKGKTVKGV